MIAVSSSVRHWGKEPRIWCSALLFPRRFVTSLFLCVRVPATVFSSLVPVVDVYDKYICIYIYVHMHICMYVLYACILWNKHTHACVILSCGQCCLVLTLRWQAFVDIFWDSICEDFLHRNIASIFVSWIVQSLRVSKWRSALAPAYPSCVCLFHRWLRSWTSGRNAIVPVVGNARLRSRSRSCLLHLFLLLPLHPLHSTHAARDSGSTHWVTGTRNRRHGARGARSPQVTRLGCCCEQLPQRIFSRIPFRLVHFNMMEIGAVY